MKKIYRLKYIVIVFFGMFTLNALSSYTCEFKLSFKNDTVYNMFLEPVNKSDGTPVSLFPGKSSPYWTYKATSSSGSRQIKVSIQQGNKIVQVGSLSYKYKYSDIDRDNSCYGVRPDSVEYKSLAKPTLKIDTDYSNPKGNSDSIKITLSQ